jgi:hypothetical protein
MVKMKYEEIEKLILKQILQGDESGVGDRQVQVYLLTEIHRLLEKVKPSDLMIPKSVLGKIVVLLERTRFSIPEIVEKAIEKFFDGEMSDDRYVWLDGVKYPIPERFRVP